MKLPYREKGVVMAEQQSEHSNNQTLRMIMNNMGLFTCKRLHFMLGFQVVDVWLMSTSAWITPHVNNRSINQVQCLGGPHLPLIDLLLFPGLSEMPNTEHTHQSKLCPLEMFWSFLDIRKFKYIKLEWS